MYFACSITLVQTLQKGWQVIGGTSAVDLLKVDGSNGTKFWGSGAHLTRKEESSGIVGAPVGFSMFNYLRLNGSRWLRTHWNHFCIGHANLRTLKWGEILGF